MARRHRPERPRSLFTRRPVPGADESGRPLRTQPTTGDDETRQSLTRPPEGGSVTLEEIRVCLGGMARSKPEIDGAADMGAGICDEGERPGDLAPPE